MNTKFFLVFIGLFTIQFLYSCDLFYCNASCSSARDYHINLTNLELDINHYNYDWDYYKEVPDSVSRSNDELSVILTFTPDFVQDPEAISFREAGGGFNTASACSDCYYESHYYLVDLIKSVDIEVLDVSNSSITAVNSLFTTTEWYTDYLPLDEVDFNAIDYFYEAPVLLYLYLEEAANIPDSSVFRVKVMMASGTNFSSETELIKFY